MDTYRRDQHDAEAYTASTMSTSSDGDIHPLLARYFDRTGDAMTLQTHLEDLDVQQVEKLTQRELLRDQDAALSTTDEDFAKEYYNSRSRLQRSLKSVQTEAEVLRSTCESYGLDIDQAKWRISNPQRLDSSSAGHSLDTSTNMTTLSSDETFKSLDNLHGVFGSHVVQGNLALDLTAHFEQLKPTSPPASQVSTTTPGPNASQSSGNLPISVESQDFSSRPTSPMSAGQGEFANFGHPRPQQSQNWNERSDMFTSVPRTPLETPSASKSTPSLLLSSNIYPDSMDSIRSTQQPTQSTDRRASEPESKQSFSQSASDLGALQTASGDGRRVKGTDSTGVRYDLTYGPPSYITDPELRRAYGVTARKLLKGTEGETEVTDSSFYVPSRPRKFFCQGKVFAILWAEPSSGSDGTTTEVTHDLKTPTEVHAKVRRFVVIRAMDNYCSAIPITTNNGQGASHPSVKKSDFAVIHTSKVPPDILSDEHPARGESAMRRISIRVDPDDRGYRLDPLSRLNFGKVYTVDYNVKVKSIGMVNRASMRDLIYQFRDVWRPAFTPPTAISDGTGITEISSQIRSPGVTQRQDFPKTSTMPSTHGRQSRPTSRKLKSSLSSDASGAVDRLLSQGHSVDQILSAFDTKSFGQSYIHDGGLEEFY